VKKILLGLLVVFFAAVGGVWLYTNQIIGSAIERGATYALGVDTRVGFVRLRLLRGDFALSGLRIDNPPGFDEPSFLDLDGAHIRVDLDTVRSEVVRIPEFTLQGVDVALEREGRKTNYGVIMANLGRFESKGAKPPPDAAPAGEKRFIVDRLLIRDVEARVEWNDLAADATGVRVEIPQIELQGIGADNARGVVMSELTAIVLKAVLGSIARYGTNLPAAVLSGLNSGLGDLVRVPGVVVSGVGKTAVDHVADAIGGEVGDAVRGVGGSATEAAGKAVGDTAGKALGGLFGGKQQEGEQ
jgi:hypothetical protein